MVTRVKLMEQQQQQQQKQRQQQQQNSASKPYRVASTGSMAQDSKNVRNNINATTDRLLKPHNTPVDHACDNVDEANPWPQDPLSGPSPNGSESTRPTPNPHPEQTGDSSATGVVTSDSSSASKSAPITTTTTTTTSSPPKSSQGKTSSGSSNSTSSHSPPPALQIYDIVRTIGKGNFAVVKLARHRMTRTEVAIKIIDKSKLDKANLEKVHREVEVMKLLDHPNIIKLYQVMTSESKIYIVSEYAPKGEIFDYIAEYGRMSEQLARRKFWQIIQAVDYCHQRRVVHRDLKAENLLLDADMNIKVADFGFSNFFKSEDWLTTWCGSPPYAAPEVFEGKKYKGPEIDIWSLGVVLYVLVCGALPFEAPDPPSLRDRVVRGTFKIPTYMSHECASLIQKMLVRDPKKRYTISMIKRDPWMRIEVPEDEMHLPDESEADDSNTVRVVKSGRKCDMPINEKCIKIMGDLGIDTNATKQAVKNEVYNHHAAIYFLILDIYNKANKPPGSSGMCSGKARHRQQQTITTPMGPPAPIATTTTTTHSQLRPYQLRPSQLQTKNPRASPSRHFSLGSDEVEHHGRRPSSVAEQVLSESNRLQIAQLAANHAGLQSGNLDSANHSPHGGNLQPQTLWQASPSIRPSSQIESDVNALRMQSPSGMVATEYDCNNCKEPILENTTSTTTCVKCARLRTRRRNFAHPTMLWSNQSATTAYSSRDHSTPHPQPYMFCSEDRTRGPHDSRDSGVSTGSSQDYGECTPPIEKSLGFPRFPARVGSSDRPSVPIYQVMRKLSEVEGIAPSNMMLRSSVDEGVEFEHGSESALSDLGSAQARRQTLSHMASFDSSSLGSYSGSFHQGFNEALGCYRDSPGGSFTSTDSSYPYESFEDGLAVGENDLNQPLPSGGGSLPSPISSHQDSSTSDGAIGMGFSETQGFLTTDFPSNYLKVPTQGTDRHLLRSPVHFREGRRASDGLLSQHMSVFNDKIKSQGYPELQRVHEEHRALQSRFGTPFKRVSLSPDGSASVRQRKGNTVLAHRPSISKRISVPENFTYFPSPANQAAPASSNDLQHLPAKQNLAHQLLQQRLQLKRHPSKPPRLFTADGSAANRRRTALSARQASKYSQQVAGVNKPYLPSQEPFLSGQVGTGVPGSEFLFQPIVEDEYGLDDLLPGGHEVVEEPQGSNSMSSENQWHTLPSYMQQTCHLGQEDSPPPPAPPDPDTLLNRDTTETMDTLSPT